MRAHVFTVQPSEVFLRHAPDFSPLVDGVEFSFGMEIPPPEEAEVLIVYNRSSYSLPVRHPRERVAFVAGEPDAIHPYKRRFLEQFGLVMTTSERPIDVPVMRVNPGYGWFVGCRPGGSASDQRMMGRDDFAALSPPEERDDRISIVTSTKRDTPFHRARLAFIEELKRRIPDRIALYGRGHRWVEDKLDALLPHRYHLALENTGGRFTWTEKLSDPLLAWALPFYWGCENPEDDLPAEALVKIDVNRPDEAIATMLRAVEENAWQARRQAIAEARRRLLDEINIMKRLAWLAREVIAAAPDARPTARPWLIRSERSLPPEPGTRGRWADTLLRSAVLSLDPRAELRLHGLRMRWERVKAARRKRRLGLR